MALEYDAALRAHGRGHLRKHSGEAVVNVKFFPSDHFVWSERDDRPQSLDGTRHVKEESDQNDCSASQRYENGFPMLCQCYADSLFLGEASLFDKMPGQDCECQCTRHRSSCIL